MNIKLWCYSVFSLGVLRTLSFLHTNGSSVTLAAGKVFGLHEDIAFPAVFASRSNKMTLFIMFAPLVSDTAYEVCATAPRVCQLWVTFFCKFFGKPPPCLRPLNRSTAPSVPLNIMHGLPYCLLSKSHPAAALGFASSPTASGPVDSVLRQHHHDCFRECFKRIFM